MIGGPVKGQPASAEPGAFGAAWRAITWLTGFEAGLSRVYHFPTWDEFNNGQKLLYSNGWMDALADGLVNGAESTKLQLAATALDPVGKPLLNAQCNPELAKAGCTHQELWLVGRSIVHNSSFRVFLLAAWAGGDPNRGRVINTTVEFSRSSSDDGVVAERVEEYTGGEMATATYDEAWRLLRDAGELQHPGVSTVLPLNDTCIGGSFCACERANAFLAVLCLPPVLLQLLALAYCL